VVSLLDRKLFRDIAAMRGQVITIALVVAAGVAVFMASVSTYNSLAAASARFYDSTRFPHLFVTLKRAPLSVVRQLETIPGVATVVPRIARDVIVDWPSSALPVSARMVSLPRIGESPLSRLYLRSGSLPDPNDPRGAVINEAFAEANHVTPGTSVRVLLNGRVETFHITGIALSPEYVFAVKPGVPIPDDRFYAVMWINQKAAEAAFALDGAFNDLAVSLAPGADPKPVIAALDRLLAQYGSVGAIERRDHSSHRFLEDELNQQRVMAVTIPFIFFGVAAFLLNVALGRMVVAQREQIASLKALGFPTAPIMLHYLKLVVLIVGAGALLGVLGGIAFGEAMIASYQGFFSLPKLVFEPTVWSAIAGAVLSLAAATLGVLTALRSVVTLAPAEAMRAAPPIKFRHSLIEQVFSARYLSPRWVMVLRNVAGRPVRAALTVLGVAFAVPMVVLGLFWRDAIDHMIDVQFNLVERGNMVVTFPRPLDRRIIGDLAREPGVLVVEAQRIVPVRLRAGHRSYLTSVIGLPRDAELRRPHDAALRPIAVTEEGLTLTRRLAERLGVTTGDPVIVEVMEGRRRVRTLPVAAVVDEVIGMASYMAIDALNHMTGEGDVASAAALYVEPATLPLLSRRLKDLPAIESVTTKAYSLLSFLDKIAGMVLVTAGILTFFAVIIAVGVVYNSARIGLQERAWELASLRVLGFTRGEVAAILFSEFMIEILIAIPIGLLLSQGIVDLIAYFHSNESFQIPPVISPRTFAASVIVVIAAAVASAYVVRRRIDRLDLVGVLKTRD